MKRMVFNAPQEWKELIKKRMQQLGYKTMSEYVRSLIRRDLEEAGLLKP